MSDYARMSGQFMLVQVRSEQIRIWQVMSS